MVGEGTDRSFVRDVCWNLPDKACPLLHPRHLHLRQVQVSGSQGGLVGVGAFSRVFPELREVPVSEPASQPAASNAHRWAARQK